MAQSERRSRTRSTEAVFNDHLRAAKAGDVDGDIERNYARDVVLLTGVGVLRGQRGVRRSRALLAHDLPDGKYTYVTRLVDGEHAFLEWRAQGKAVEIDDGADSFVIRDGLIRLQTIHYTMKHRTGYHEAIKTHSGPKRTPRRSTRTGRSSSTATRGRGR
jgi:hypothetical protein